MLSVLNVWNKTVIVDHHRLTLLLDALPGDTLGERKAMEADGEKRPLALFA